MDERMRRVVKKLIGSGTDDYDTLVTLIDEKADMIPDEVTARDVYRDCRIVENGLRREIVRQGHDKGARVVGVLERQESVTAKVKGYAKQRGWDLSPIDREPLYSPDERQK